MKRLLFLCLFLTVSTIVTMAQSYVYEPYDFRVSNEDGDTLYYRITSNTEPFSVALTRCHDSIFHNLQTPTYAYQVGQPGFAYPVYDYDSLLNIPSSVSYNGTIYMVTSIDKEAFYLQKNLKTVNLPSSIRIIDSAAFYQSSLQEITLQEGVEQIKYGAFCSCPLIQIDLPQSLSHIGEMAFSACTQLTSIVIPTGITKVPASCFSFCDLLSDVVLPESLVTIEELAFLNTRTLQQIVIPAQVQNIGPNAFCKEQVSTAGTFRLVMKGTVPPQMSASFLYDTVYCTVPFGTIEVYENAWETDYTEFVFSEPTSVEEIDEREMEVYPNPAHNQLNIRCGQLSVSSLQLFDAFGKLLLTRSVNDGECELDLTAVPAGIYLLKAELEDGSIEVLKVVKK